MKIASIRLSKVAAVIPFVVMLEILMTAATSRATETKIPVTISGGHDIAKNDYGRPITLMAAALGVKPEEFHKAFSGSRLHMDAGQRALKRVATKKLS